MNTFDVIMNNCPFLKKVIEDKLREEASKLQLENEALKKENQMLNDYVLDLDLRILDIETVKGGK